MSAATIGSALVERRRELGLAKGQAANKIGVSRTTYSSYERDAQRPSVDVFPALARFLDISIEELLALYGATCVAAVRSSLERVMSNPQDGSEKTERAEEIPSVIELPEWGQPGTPYEGLTIPPEGLESMSTVVMREVAESEESQGSNESLESSDVREEQTLPLEREADAEEPAKLRSAFFQPSPLVMKSSKSESRDKDPGHKKKKKKKNQKKN